MASLVLGCASSSFDFDEDTGADDSRAILLHDGRASAA